MQRNLSRIVLNGFRSRGRIIPARFYSTNLEQQRLQQFAKTIETADARYALFELANPVQMEIQEFSANGKILELISKLNSTGFQVKNYSVEYLTRPRFENGETANEADMYNISRHSDIHLGHPFLQVYIEFQHSNSAAQLIAIDTLSTGDEYISTWDAKFIKNPEHINFIKENFECWNISRLNFDDFKLKENLRNRIKEFKLNNLQTNGSDDSRELYLTSRDRSTGLNADYLNKYDIHGYLSFLECNVFVEEITPGKFIVVLPNREANIRLAGKVYDQDEHFIKDVVTYTSRGNVGLETHICHFSYLTISAPSRDRILPPFEVEVTATYAHNIVEKHYYDNYYLYDENDLEKGIFTCSTGQIREYSGIMKDKLDAFLEQQIDASAPKVKKSINTE